MSSLINFLNRIFDSCNPRGGGSIHKPLYIKRIIFLLLAFFSISLWTNPAAAAFSIEYQAPANPATQGFRAVVVVPPAPQVLGPIADDLGYPAWSISGLGLSSQFIYLTGALNAAQKADINSQGFTLTLRGRVLQGSAPAFDAGYNTVIGAAFLDTGSGLYYLSLGVNSSGNTVVVLLTHYDAYGPGGSIRGYGPTYALNDAGYHTYDLVFNPQTQSASLFIDGVERLSGYTGYTGGRANNGLVFGAISGGGMNFNLGRLTSPAVVPADPNLIDATHGAGTGSFELGAFVNNGSGFMGVLRGDNTTIRGWTVGGPGDGVDWLISPIFRADTGVHAVDLQRWSASSIATVIPTVAGEVYKLSFGAATVPNGTATGIVLAGSLVNQPFTAAFSNGPATQTFTPFTFLFAATGPTTEIRFESTATTTYGPVIDSVSVVPVSNFCGGSLKTPCSYEFTLEQGSQKTESIQFLNPGTVARTATLDVINPHSDHLPVSLSQSSLSIAAGETKTLSIDLNASTTSVGVYDDLLLKVTADDGSTLYSNLKVYVTPTGVGQLPDLAITANDLSSATNADGSVTLTATVHNRGTAPASNVRVQFYEFDTPLGEPTIAQIAPNGIGNASITVPAMTAGDHLIRVVVDPAGAIVELDETNNEASRLIAIGSSGPPTEGNILVTGSLPTTVYTGSLFTLSGSAVYDLYINGVRNTDYVVKGAPVQITVQGNAVYGDIHTDVNGNFAKTLQAPATPGTYHITLTVTDKTFVGTRDLTFIVEVPPPTPPSPPLPPTTSGSGHWTYDTPTGTWTWVWTTPPANEPSLERDLRVFSEKIYFSKNNPAPDEEITLFAEIQYWATSTSLLSDAATVNVYVTDPATHDKLKVGQTVINSLSVGSPDFGSRYVYATWKNRAAGIYLVEFEIVPSYLEYTGNNAAIRAIIVGQVQSQQGAISGQVTTSLGGVGGVMIQVFDVGGTSPIGNAVTDPTGFYLVANVPLGGAQVRITPPSGYLPDATTKTVTVSNQAVSAVDFRLTKQAADTTPPVLSLPSAITAEAAGPSGAAVTYTASATDDVDGAITPTCTPASGSTFGLGLTTVNCSATDQAGNTANGNFTVTVVDTTPPTITVPGHLTAEATGPSGATVTYTATATDTVSGALTPSCDHISGSIFALGTTTVTCSATDQAGNAASGNFTVTVRDTTPPTVTVPDDLTAEATSSSGAAVTFTASATDTVSGALTPTCAPASDSTFPIGTTTVNCSATDQAQNTARGSFKVTVNDTTPPPPSTFSAFNINRLGINQRLKTWSLLSSFTLGQGSNGINPATEPVTLAIANFNTTIPAGSFRKGQLGVYTFAGKINNVSIEALIAPLGNNRFGFQAVAYGANLSGATNPVTVRLTIGDESGTTTVNNAIIR